MSGTIIAAGLICLLPQTQISCNEGIELQKCLELGGSVYNTRELTAQELEKHCPGPRGLDRFDIHEVFAHWWWT